MSRLYSILSWANARGAKIWALRFRRVDEISLAGVAVELFFFFVGDLGMIGGDVVEDVAVDDEQIAPATALPAQPARLLQTTEKAGETGQEKGPRTDVAGAPGR